MQFSSLMLSICLISLCGPHASAVINNLPATVRSNLSPYLHLTRNEFLLNDTFPAYQKLVRPDINAFAQQFEPTLSPYLHLKRKTVNPLLPVYQQIVRPTLEQRQRATSTRRLKLPTTGLISTQHHDQTGKFRVSRGVTTTSVEQQLLSEPQLGISPVFDSTARSQLLNLPVPLRRPIYRTLPSRMATPFNLRIR